MKKVCIIYNEQKVKALSFYEETRQFFIDRKIEIVPLERVEEACFAITIGGDGTLLRAAKKIMKNKEIFVVAVNMGSLGFLTEIKASEAFETYKQVLEGRYKLEERKLLEINIKGGRYHALNELVFSKGGKMSKLIKVSMYSKEQGYINTYRADGVIVATPTGSTAYSLSAGGPLIKPGLNAMVITPIAPHNLSTRPIVIDGNEELEVEAVDVEMDTGVTIDGEKCIKLTKGERVGIRYSDKVLKLVVPSNRNYYGVLREKLKWGDEIC